MQCGDLRRPEAGMVVVGGGVENTCMTDSRTSAFIIMEREIGLQLVVAG